MKKYLLPLLLCFCMPLFFVGCDLLLTLLGFGLGDVKITMTISDLTQELTFNQSTVPTSTDEYAWGVLIDIDDDLLTGDPSGFDARIDLRRTTPSYTASEVTRFLEEFIGTSYIFVDIYEWSATYSSFVTTAGYEGEYGEVNIDGNTITIYTYSRYAELSSFSSASRSQFFTLYYQPGVGPQQDFTGDIFGNGTISDAAGDSGGFVFIDIVSGAIEFPL